MCSGSILGVGQFRLSVGGGQGNFLSDMTRKMVVVVVDKGVEYATSESFFSDSMRPLVFLVSPSLSFACFHSSPSAMSPY